MDRITTNGEAFKQNFSGFDRQRTQEVNKCIIF